MIGDREGLIVLLGAGASLPGMLTTAQVTTRLRSWDLFREPSASPPTPSSPLLTAPSGVDTRPPFFEALAKIVETGLRQPATLNFEHLVHATELLASLMPLPANSSTVDAFRFLLGPFLNAHSLVTPWNIDGPNYSVAADAACHEILDWFATCCDSVALPTHPLAEGLRRLARGRPLRVFSLNYDDLPYEGGIQFYTGFDSNGRFAPEYPWPSWRHTLCQLHGSVRFGKRDFEIAWFPTRADAKTARRSKDSGRIFQDGHRGTGAPMITGLRKADKTLARPFGTYMHVFREWLLRCNHWLIVGYGFADEHVNEAMLQARANWKQRGRPVRAAIVDYHKPHLDSYGDPLLDAWHGTDAANLLERLCSRVFSDDIYEFTRRKLPKLHPSLFTEISDDVAVDLNGTAVALGRNLRKLLSFIERDLPTWEAWVGKFVASLAATRGPTTP